MKRADYKESFANLAMFLVNMKGKTQGRDDTITLAFTYDNFADYFNSNKHMFVLGFSTLDNFLIALLRNFFMAQIACVTHEATEETRNEILDMFNEIAHANLEKFKERLFIMHAITYRKIEELHRKQLRSI